MRQFNLYEFAAILVPGSVVLMGLASLFLPLCITSAAPPLCVVGPTQICSAETLSIRSIMNTGVAGFGALTLAAYVLGRLVQAVVCVIERVFLRRWGSMATDWVRSHANRLLPEFETRALRRMLSEHVNPDVPSIESCTSDEWDHVVRRVYADVAGAGKSGRVDAFKGSYNMHFGLVVGIGLIVIVGLCIPCSNACVLLLGGMITMGLSGYRVHYFGRKYAHELFVQFLHIHTSDLKRTTQQ